MYSFMKFFFVTLTVESLDRSTTREYGDLSTQMEKKFKLLKSNEEDAIKQDNEHYQSLLRQVRTDGIKKSIYR